MLKTKRAIICTILCAFMVVVSTFAFFHFESSDSFKVNADSHNSVDLGLPSGLRWADVNYGASACQESGTAVQWGCDSKYIFSQALGSEEEYKRNYSSRLTYDRIQYTKDFISQKYGDNNWRTPTEADYEELIANCDTEWVTNYNNTNVNGLLVTGKNGNSIFLPAYSYEGAQKIKSSGKYVWDKYYDDGTDCYYWTTTKGLGEYSVASFHADNSGDKSSSYFYRPWQGLYVRPVYEPTFSITNGTQTLNPDEEYGIMGIDQLEAKNGATIDVYVSYDYENNNLKRLYYKYDDTEVEITDIDPTNTLHRTFKMPGHNVTVYAEFVQLIEKPKADESTFVFNGTEQTYKVAENDAYTIQNNKQTQFGLYNVTVSLKDKSGSRWLDGTTDDIIFEFEIEQLFITKPEADTSRFVEDGNVKTYNIPENEYYTISGNKQTAAGTYTVTVALTDKYDTCWDDGKVGDLTFTFEIEDAPQTPPEDEPSHDEEKNPEEKNDEEKNPEEKKPEERVFEKETITTKEEDLKEGVKVNEVFSAANTSQEEKGVEIAIDSVGSVEGGEKKSGSIVFTPEAVAQIAQALGGDVVLKVEIEKDITKIETSGKVDEELKNEVKLVVELDLGGVEFNDGAAEINLPFDEEVPEGKCVVIYYVDKDGNKTPLDTDYKDGMITFSTTHFSTYVALIEDAPKSGLGAGAIIGIVLGSLVVVLLVAYIVMFFMWKKNGKGLAFLTASFAFIDSKLFKAKLSTASATETAATEDADNDKE